MRAMWNKNKQIFKDMPKGLNDYLIHLLNVPLETNNKY